MPHNSELRDVDTGLLCRVILTRRCIVWVGVDPFVHRFGETDRPLDTLSIPRACKQIGFKAKVATAQWSRLAKRPVPAYAGHIGAQ